MSGRYVPEHPLDGRLRLLGSDARAEERLEVIWSYFEEVTGERISRPPSQDQRREVLAWLRAQIGTENWPMLFASWPVLHTAAHQTLVEKASNVRKLRPCTTTELVSQLPDTPLHPSSKIICTCGCRCYTELAWAATTRQPWSSS
jgi:hypothetical protein